MKETAEGLLAKVVPCEKCGETMKVNIHQDHSVKEVIDYFWECKCGHMVG